MHQCIGLIIRHNTVGFYDLCTCKRCLKLFTINITLKRKQE
jgi:hypothetical protein